MDLAQQFLLTNEEVVWISKLLGDRYSESVICMVHTGMLFAPRLISMDIIPGPENVDLLDPDFRLDSFHIAATTRILGIAKFGMLFFSITEAGNYRGWDDVNAILSAFQQVHAELEEEELHSAAVWLSTFVDLKVSTDDQVFKLEPIVCEEMWEEMELCETVMLEAADMSSLVTPKHDIKSGLMKLLGSISEALQRLGGGDATDCG